MNLPPYIMARGIAFVAGIVIYYFASHQFSKVKKDRVSTFLSLLTSFVVVMFLMKFVTKFPMVFEYPLALLAYPSGTFEFYLACVVMVFFYQKEYIKNKNKESFHYDLLMIVTGSSFFFYLINLSVFNEGVLLEMGLWFCLYLSALLINEFWREMLFVGMSIATVLSFTLEVPAVMGIRVHKGFYLFLTLFSFIFILKKRRNSKWDQT
ncbi:hypothetical protein [Halobacillus mangrovi]|uniref:Uncharacterized protein n=1 Tax=Halobacillus mangrovi TaxID=402384 RepID=A0A1W5ZR60_9BACI|nr:hypothetical protein [Halobacillus mangrovi]ARI75775.1 hypothetical protein HM131_02550 [Halobacillus mangrovi]